MLASSGIKLGSNDFESNEQNELPFDCDFPFYLLYLLTLMVENIILSVNILGYSVTFCHLSYLVNNCSVLSSSDNLHTSKS